MKSSIATLAAVLILSLGVWALFYVLTPDAPLTPSETAVVVGASAVVVLAIRWIWSWLRKPPGGTGHVQ